MGQHAGIAAQQATHERLRRASQPWRRRSEGARNTGAVATTPIGIRCGKERKGGEVHVVVGKRTLFSLLVVQEIEDVRKEAPERV